MIVVDASVAVKWLLWEPDSPEARSFLRTSRGNIWAPEIIFIEVAGVLVRSGNMNKDHRSAVLRSLHAWTIAWSAHSVKNIRMTQRRLYRASALALDLGTPLKDCIYLAVAMEMDAELATCDVRFRDKAHRIYPKVRLLSEYEA